MVSFIQHVFLKGSLFEVLVVVALAGALSSLSSCTIARLPVLLGLVSSSSQTRRHGFLLTIAFSCGLIISYTSLGVLLAAVAHIASRLIEISQYLYLIFGLLMILAGLFFSGLIFNSRALNTSCQRAMQKVKTPFSAFIFGLLFALLEMPACPCCGAVLLLIASLIAIKGSWLYSGMVFFTFALGQSVPLLLIGFSTSLLKSILPQTRALEGIISFSVGNILIISGAFLVMLA